MIQKKFLKQLNNAEQNILVEENAFSPEGLLLSTTEFDKEGNIFAIEKQVYTPDGQILKQTTTVPPEQEETLTYHYNDKGQPTRHVHLFNGEDAGTAEYTYDEQGRLLKIEYFEDGSLERKESFDHDQAIQRDCEYGLDGEILMETITQLDSSGNAIEEKEIIHGGMLAGETITKNTYDEQGNCIRTEIYEGDELVLEEDYFFNEQGVEVKSVGQDHEAAEKTEINRVVNAQGKVTKEEQFLNGELDFSFVKEYNDQGQLVYEKNWALDNGFGEEELTVFVYTYE